MEFSPLGVSLRSPSRGYYSPHCQVASQARIFLSRARTTMHATYICSTSA